jgi:hypothetical protein
VRSFCSRVQACGLKFVREASFPLVDFFGKLNMNRIIKLVLFSFGLLLSDRMVIAADLFVSNFGSNTICEFTPSGSQSTFASGLNGPVGLAFDSSGNLFEVDNHSGNIYKFTPSGSRSTFASGLNLAESLAFDSYGNLYLSDWGSDSIYKFTPGGSKSTFASGLNNPYG